MRGAIQYFLFSGLAWFGAAALFVIAVVVCRGDPAGRPRATHGVSPTLRFAVARILILLAIGVGALSGTPLQWWLTVAVVAATLAYALALRNRTLAGVAMVLVAAAVLLELRYFRWRVVQPPPKSVAVIGDSISSGGFGEDAPWPELLPIPAVNLSQPSETVSSALLYQLPRLPRTEAVVVAVGGNDMLGGTSAATFSRDLDHLLRSLRGRTVVMLELPILPGKWALGAAQRRLARKHNVTLIPKRVLARVLTRPGLTSDDALHLTQRGHELLARKIGHALGARARADR